MAKNGDALPGAIARAIDRIKDPRFLSIIVMVGIFLIYSGVTTNATLAAITVIMGIVAIVVFSAFDRPSGIRMHVAFVLPEELKDPNVRIRKCDYEVYSTRNDDPIHGTLHPVRGPGEGSLFCALPKEARPNTVVGMTLKDENENEWAVEEFEPEMLMPPVRVLDRRTTKKEPPLLLKGELAEKSEIHLANFARPLDVKAGRQYYQWKVFVEADEELLKQIRQVEYVLHPTFTPPRRIEDKWQNKFALTSSGWGEFNILAYVRFYDQREQTLSHHLDLKSPWPSE